MTTLVTRPASTVARRLPKSRRLDGRADRPDRRPAWSSRLRGVLLGLSTCRLSITLLALALGPLLALSHGPAAADLVEPAGVWPLSPRPDVVAGFDPPAVRWESGHRGVDLAGRLGQPVRAALGGRVTYAGRLAGRGVVVVDHGRTRTTYEPVTAVVRGGDGVRAGGPIGRLDLVGSHCFPRVCLHWGLLEGRDHYLDPLTVVGAAPVILLPLLGDPALVAGADPVVVARSSPDTAPPVGAGPGRAVPRHSAGMLPPVALPGRTAAPSWLRPWPHQARGWAWR